ncbi:MAG: hypothetical protein KGJ78_16535 [Alphaproteobacteria bacterium]|nr:hypothetical protein [Alphaproteobacteria bacterium]
MAYDPDSDDFLGEDIGYPNRRAQYRGYRIVRAAMLGAGILALVFGLLEGGSEIRHAFPTMASLSDGAAWSTFWAGLGTLAKVGLALILVALVWRWRKRRRTRRMT